MIHVYQVHIRHRNPDRDMGYLETGRSVHTDTYREALGVVWAFVEEHPTFTVTPVESAYRNAGYGWLLQDESDKGFYPELYRVWIERDEL